MMNGTYWKDTEGEGIQAHGGCLLFHEGVYYWYGENKKGETHDGRTDFMGFNCYSSQNLKDWCFEGTVLQADQSDPYSELGARAVGERPKVLYNTFTKQFVMWFHLDSADYNLAHTGVAVSKRPQGPFTYLGKKRPGGMRESRDMTLFQDKDGSAYLLSSSDGNGSILISQLDEMYTDFTGNTKTILEGQFREAPVLFCHGGLYYLLTSGCTGWNANPALYAIAESIFGRWRLIDNPCEGADSRTCYHGQPAHIIEVDGEQLVLMDHWKPENLRESGYSLLKAEFDGDIFRLPWCKG